MDVTSPSHVHAWSSMRFELREGHPWVVETCADCGAARRYRAFERTWDPSAGERDRRRDVSRAAAGGPGLTRRAAAGGPAGGSPAGGGPAGGGPAGGDPAGGDPAANL